jgi:hypothetical protein
MARSMKELYDDLSSSDEEAAEKVAEPKVAGDV